MPPTPTPLTRRNDGPFQLSTDNLLPPAGSAAAPCPLNGAERQGRVSGALAQQTTTTAGAGR